MPLFVAMTGTLNKKNLKTPKHVLRFVRIDIGLIIEGV